MANTIARLGVRLGIDSAEFSKGIEAAKKDLASFASEAKNYAIAGATAFAAMTYKALEFADSIADVATANEVAIETVLKLSEALAQNGGKAENASKMLSSFTAFVDKAATGSFEAQKSFKDVGISLKDLGSMSMEQLLAKTLRGIEKMPDNLTAMARSMEFFGKAVKGVAIGDLARDMEKVGHITEVQAQSVKDAGDAWDKLNARTHETLVNFTALIGTPTLSLLKYLEDLSKEAEKVTDTFLNLGRNMKMLYDFTTAFGFAMFGADAEKLKKFNDEYAKFLRMQQLGKFDQGNYEGWMPKEGATGFGRKTKVGVDAEAAKLAALALHNNRIINKDLQEQDKLRMETLKKEVDAYHTVALRQMQEEKGLKDQQALFDLSIEALHMRKEDAQLAKDLYEIESNRAEKMKAISRDTILDKESKVELLKAEQDIADQAERYARARNQATKAVREGTFGEGFSLAMGDYFRNAATELERGQQAFESVMGNMNAALDNFVRNGKLSFKDLARSIIQDLIAVELKAQALSIFKGMGGMGMFSSLFAPANAGGYSTSMAQFADGGSPPVGQASLVGERGPELFVPKTAGTIIPNNMLGSMGSNQPSITYNGPYIANMSAIDTQSATQFLAKNKSAVWAANQTAQRSLPQSR
jgi:lambda family phage tail tape measure protein